VDWIGPDQVGTGANADIPAKSDDDRQRLGTAGVGRTLSVPLQGTIVKTLRKCATNTNIDDLSIPRELASPQVRSGSDSH
jgi:hypothetical protein